MHNFCISHLRLVGDVRVQPISDIVDQLMSIAAKPREQARAVVVRERAIRRGMPLAAMEEVLVPLYLFHQMLRPVHGLLDRGLEPLVRRITGGEESSSSPRGLVLWFGSEVRARMASG